MKLQLSKYHGTGNDHILVDDRSGALMDLGTSTIKKLCDRKFGIGSDGLILVRQHETADVEMVFYNPDGSQSFCGNGSRCLMAYCESLGISKGTLSFHAIDGFHQGKVENGHYSIEMNDVLLDGIEHIGDDIFIDTGSPHYIVFVENVDDVDLVNEAGKIRYSERFKEKGTNVNFVEMRGGSAKVRTYERGVEGETLSCGTGVTAVTLALAVTGKVQDVCHINTPGGDLKVRFSKGENTFQDIWMTGPAVHVFDAEIEI